MPNILTLNPPYQGMSQILNVTQKVGPDPDCANLRMDVEAVQALLFLAVRTYPGVHGFGIPHTTGRFDALTGFYIFHIQCKENRQAAGTVIDGCVSPARGGNYGGGVYTIIRLNFLARSASQDAWEGLVKVMSQYK